MLENLLEGLKTVGAPLERVVLYQGGKVYGVHLGPVLAPFYEDDARHIPPNFYYAQEDTLRRRADAGEFEWSILRPDVVIGDVVGNPMNIAMVIGVFAALSKATGTPLRFPGSTKSTTAYSLRSPTPGCWVAPASGAPRRRRRAARRSSMSMNPSAGSASGGRSDAGSVSKSRLRCR